MNKRLGGPWIFFIYCLSYCCWPITGLAQDPYFIHYQTKDGLSSAVTYACFQDSKGYIWIASDWGVNRFDGQYFQNFTYSDGLTDNDVFNFFEDSKGRIWLYTFNGTACHFQDEQFFNAQNNPVLGDLSLPGFISHICEDKKGNIYFSSNGLQSKILTAKNEAYTFLNSGTPSNICFSWLGEDGQQFFARELGISKARSLSIIPYPKIEGKPIRGFARACEDGDRIFLGIKKQIVIYNKITERFDETFIVKEIDTEIIFIKYQNQALWLGTRNGVFILKPSGDTFKTYSVNRYLEGYSVSSVLEDQETNLWFSTLEGGVFFTPVPKGLLLTTKDGLAINYTFYLSKDNQQRLWIGGAKNYYSIFGQNKFTTSKLAGSSDLEVTRIRHFGTDEHWVLGQGQMVFYDGAEEKYVFIHTDDIAKDKFGYYWFGYRKMYRFSSEEIKSLFVEKDDPDFFLKMTSPPKELVDNSGVDIKRFTCLIPDNKNNMWVGTTSGLFWYRYDSFGITEKRERRLVEGKITSLAFDSTRNLLWVATSSDGVHLVQKDSVIASINKKDGLASNFITSIVLDEKSKLWVGGVNGVDVLEWKEGVFQIQPFTRQQGLFNLKINSIELLGEQVYLATENGLIVLPGEVEIQKTYPPLYILDFKVNGKSAAPNVSRSYKYNENAVEFSFQSLNYKNRGNIVYHYRLAGEDKEWVSTKSNSIQYRSLAPGKYRFEVKTKNIDSRGWTIAEGPGFEIKAPFWQQIWFVLLSGLSLFYLVYLLWQKRIQNITKKHHLQQRLIYTENDKLELEKNFLELEMRALRLQMNPHFMFNALNTIKGYYAKDKTREANAYISKFAQLLRLILKNNDKFIPLETEVEILELYMKLSQIRYENVFNYKIEMPAEIDCQDVAIPPMLLQPMVENSIIHGLAPREKMGAITISFAIEGATLVSKIRDNGIGREAAKAFSKHRIHSSQATQTTAARLAIINKEYDITDCLSIVDLKNKEGRVVGTEVTIITPLKKLWQ